MKGTGLMPIRMDFREYALSSRKSEGKLLGLLYAHARGAASELRLATDLPALQDFSTIQTSCNTCSGETLFCYCST